MDAYDYDRSLFYRLLESTPKFKAKLDLVQERQGLIVCPLELKSAHLAKLKTTSTSTTHQKNPDEDSTTSTLSSSSFDLIDSHLFVPSPFYKNQYIPLSSFSFSFSTNHTNANANANANIFDPSSQHSINHVHLNLNEENNRFVLMNQRQQQICKHVKLLAVQKNYTESMRLYKVLVVNKPIIYFATRQQLSANSSNSSSMSMPDLSSHTTTRSPKVDPDDMIADDQLSSMTEPATSSSSKPSSRASDLFTLNQVKTFSKCIDFMHEFVGLGLNRSSAAKQERIGEGLLDELDLFRKTYIVLPGHLEDCCRHMRQIYEKHCALFLKSIKKMVTMGVGGGWEEFGANESLTELIVSVGCETVINGCLYPKVWPCVLKVSGKEDASIEQKCKELRIHLGLEDSENNEEWFSKCANFFHIDQKYFRLNYFLVLKEIKRLEMLNNPFEKLEAIKTTIDMLTNEITLFDEENNNEITADLLIPLMSFILVKSSITCLQSLIVFIEMFAFSSQPSQHSNANNSQVLTELGYFFTTFRASVQYILSTSFLSFNQSALFAAT